MTPPPPRSPRADTLCPHTTLFRSPCAEEHGGRGGGALENAIVMEELGKSIGIEPYLPSVVIAGGALKAVGGAQADAMIPEIIAGNAIVAFAHAEPQGR